MADYLAGRGKRLNNAARDALVEAFRRQLRYRRLVEQEYADPRDRSRKNAA